MNVAHVRIRARLGEHERGAAIDDAPVAEELDREKEAHYSRVVAHEAKIGALHEQNGQLQRELDAGFLMWDIRRFAHMERFPAGRRTVIHFRFTDAPKGERLWWLVVDNRVADLCRDDPGHELTVIVESTVRALTEVWTGDSEQHISTDIAYAVWHYWRWTGAGLQRAVRQAPEGQRSGIREAYLRQGSTEYQAAVGARTNSALQRFHFDILHFSRLAEVFGSHSLFDITLRGGDRDRARGFGRGDGEPGPGHILLPPAR